MKLSIITINYNNKTGLEKTFNSVIGQTSHEFEWVIIDGGSTDGSKEVIINLTLNDNLNPNVNIGYWCSEPDNGIYNAMNKGIAHATGEYLHFLHSGDSLVDKHVISDFNALSCEEDIVAGDIILDSDPARRLNSPREEDIDYDFFKYSMVRHSASYMKRSLFLKYGGYDEKYRIVSDMKYFMETLLKYNCTYRHWNRIVTDFNTDGISENPQTHELDLKERAIVFEDFLPRYYRSIKKRDKRIKELDKSLMTLFKEKLQQKFRRILS